MASAVLESDQMFTRRVHRKSSVQDGKRNWIKQEISLQKPILRFF